MNRALIFFGVLIFIFSVRFVLAQDSKKKDSSPPQGMEVMNIGNRKDLTILVPKGSRVTQDNNVLMVEGIGEYSSRKFSEIEDRFAKVEKGQEELRVQLSQMIKLVEDLQKQMIALADQRTPADK